MEVYSYLWLREDESPYYVGKGSGNRAFRKHLNGGRILYPPKDKSRIFIFPQDNEADAFESEIALIALFGRKDLGTGCLQNFTDGGENPPNAKGKKRSEETLEKMRKAQRGHRGNWGSKRSKETKEKMRLVQLGRTHSPAALAKMRSAHAHPSQATRDKISASLKGKPSYFRTPEYKAKMSDIGKSAWITRRQKIPTSK